jgi:AcrR family transcriptional regulator
MASGATNRKRLPPDARRTQLLAVASEMVLEQGGLPLSIAGIGRKAGVSKALFYAYFPTQYDLFNAVLVEHFKALEARGLLAAASFGNLREAAVDSALIYFDHIAANGTVLHVVMRDPYMAGHLSASVRTFRDRVFGALARSARANLHLDANEAIAAVSLVLTIPEEAGRLAFANEMKRERARELCRDLVTSALASITPR